MQANTQSLAEIVKDTEMFLKENGEKLPLEDKTALERKLNEAKTKCLLLSQKAEESRKELDKAVTTAIKQETEKVLRQIFTFPFKMIYFHNFPLCVLVDMSERFQKNRLTTERVDHRYSFLFAYVFIYSSNISRFPYSFINIFIKLQFKKKSQTVPEDLELV